MSSNWITPQLRDTDQTFDPYLTGTKPQFTGFVGSDGVDATDKYAPLQFGQMAPATGMIATSASGGFGNQDLNQLFAALGTASYLQTPAIGTPYSTFDFGVTITDRLTSRVGVIFRANGTWEVWLYTTNYKTDSPGLYSGGGGNANATNYSNGLLLSSGSWTQNNPVNSPYVVSATISGSETGTAQYYVFAQNQFVNYQNGYLANGNALDGFHNYLYRSDANYSAIPDGRSYSLSGDVTYMLILDAQGGSNGRAFFDANGALSWYNMCFMSFTISLPGKQSVTANTQLRNIIRWNPWNWTTGGGGTGGGGCVTVDSHLYEYGYAAYAEAGHTLELCDPDGLGSVKGEIEYSKRKERQPCVKITTISGVTLTCSETAPIPIKTGHLVLAPWLKDLEVAVRLPSGETRWEVVSTVLSVGLMDVQHISVKGKDKCFWAGTRDRGWILHHNKQNAETNQ